MQGPARGPCGGQPRTGRGGTQMGSRSRRTAGRGRGLAAPRSTRSKLPARGEAGRRQGKWCNSGWCFARHLPSRGGCAQRGRPPGRPGLEKSGVIHCPRAWHSASGDGRRPRAYPHVRELRPPFAAPPERGPAGPGLSRGRLLAPRPPHSTFRGSAVSEGAWGRREPRKALVRGLGRRRLRPRMPAEPAVSGAPPGAGPGRGEVGGRAVAPVDSPFFPAPPPEGSFTLLGCPAGKGEGTSGAGVPGEAPGTPSRGPRGLRALGGRRRVSHEARAQPAGRGGAGPARRGANSIRQRERSSEILGKSNFRVLIPWLSAPLGSEDS